MGTHGNIKHKPLDVISKLNNTTSVTDDATNTPSLSTISAHNLSFDQNNEPKTN